MFATPIRSQSFSSFYLLLLLLFPSTVFATMDSLYLHVGNPHSLSLIPFYLLLLLLFPPLSVLLTLQPPLVHPSFFPPYSPFSDVHQEQKYKVEDADGLVEAVAAAVTVAVPSLISRPCLVVS